MSDLKQLERDLKLINWQLKNTKSYLRQLIKVVEAFGKFMDEEMRGPSTYERGQRIAKALNGLEFAKDLAKRGGFPKKVKSKVKK